MLVWRVFVVLLVVESLLVLCHSTVAQQHCIVYSRDQLMALKPAGLATVREDIPAELWRKTHRGCRGERSLRRRKGAKHRRLMERKTYKPCLPSIIMGNELRRSLDGVRTRISRAGVAAKYVGFSAHRINSGWRGRPAIHVTRDQIDFLMKQGNTVKRIAKILGCSSSFLYKRTKLLGIPVRRRFSVIDDEELERHMMRGLLRADGLLLPRRRVREMLAHINPAAAARRWSSTVARRVYHIPYPNSLWHIDGNMRLIRWGSAVHGAIDGHSRLITYLNCNTNNRATTVLCQFLKATCHYGLPSRVRSDYGGENLQVALFLNLVQGIERRSFITGESIHNQRIERLWRDVFLHVLQSFYSTFYSLEDSHLLDPSNDIHKLSLSMVFLPEIQKSLERFREAWNNHALRMENNQTSNLKTKSQNMDGRHALKYGKRQCSDQQCVRGKSLQPTPFGGSSGTAWN
ncbi:uncharacterized protein LOC117250648 isoform X2 [Epinephelus lanceolatus]